MNRFGMIFRDAGFQSRLSLPAAGMAGCLLVLAPDVAHAYMDPGTISTLLHSVLASLVALGIALKLYWHRLLRFLGLRKPSPEARTERADESEHKDNAAG